MNLKDLQTLLKMCRKAGVTEIDFGDPTVCICHVKFGDLPLKALESNEESDTELTPDELIYFSTGGGG